jgi:hypothetical protein
LRHTYIQKIQYTIQKIYKKKPVNLCLHPLSSVLMAVIKDITILILHNNGVDGIKNLFCWSVYVTICNSLILKNKSRAAFFWYLSIKQYISRQKNGWNYILEQLFIICILILLQYRVRRQWRIIIKVIANYYSTEFVVNDV